MLNDLFAPKCQQSLCPHMQKAAMAEIVAAGMREFCVELKKPGIYKLLSKDGKELVDQMAKEREKTAGK